MKKNLYYLALAFVIALAARELSGDTHYVNAGNPAPIPPYTDWPTAATNIQDAVSLASDGDTVLVTNGVYSGIGGILFGTNVVLVTKAITIESVNGPDVTIVDGGNGYRCFYITNGVDITGFTLTNGLYERVSGPFLNGGGVYCDHGGIVKNCRIVDNSAYNGAGAYCNNGGMITNCIIRGNSGGAGAFCYYGGIICDSLITENLSSGVNLHEGGIVRNCTITGNSAGIYAGGIGSVSGMVYNCAINSNSALYGGGVNCGAGTILVNCTITDNIAGYRGGGVYCSGKAMLYNCLVYYNKAVGVDNICPEESGSRFLRCCTYPNPGGTDVITNSPGLVSLWNPHLVSNSPCVNAGTNVYVSSVDIDGEPRLYGTAVDIGCDEYVPAGITGQLAVAVIAEYTNSVGMYYPIRFQSNIRGKARCYEWQFGDGTIVSNHAQLTHVYDAPGNYEIILNAWNSSGAAVGTAIVTIAEARTNYVHPSGGNQWPYTNWASAARDIQNAVNAAFPGHTVLVTNGIYAPSSQLSIDKGVRIKSVNGPAGTVLNGNGSRRCCFIAHEYAVIDGLTISNGYKETEWFNQAPSAGGYGGGVWFQGAGTLANCTIVDNSAANKAGGVFFYYGGILDSCTVRNNYSPYGGAGIICYYGGEANNCVITSNTTPNGGAGVMILEGTGTVRNCTISENTADLLGGGVWCFARYGLVENCVIRGNKANEGAGVLCSLKSVIRNCLISKNYAARYGAARIWSFVENCTIVDNISTAGTSAVYCHDGSILRNSIVYFNTNNLGVADNIGYDNINSVTYCCTVPLIPGTGNITNDPRFVSFDDYHLSSDSSCIGAGIDLPWMDDATDLDGNPRTMCGVDMGCYEFPLVLCCSFTASPTLVPIDTDVYFNSVVEGTNTDNIYYRWDFENDGSSDVEGITSNAPIWRYELAGTYSVVLMVSNLEGEVATSLRPEYIEVIPEAGCLFMICYGISLCLALRSAT